MTAFNLIIDVIAPMSGGWHCLALLLNTDGTPLSVQQIVLTADDTLVYMRDTVDVVYQLARLRSQQIDHEMTVKETQRAERLVDLYMRQAAFLVRQLTRPAKAPVDVTPAERLEMEALLLMGRGTRRHVGAGW